MTHFVDGLQTVLAKSIMRLLKLIFLCWFL
jgi:hypothetical protein